MRNSKQKAIAALTILSILGSALGMARPVNAASITTLAVALTNETAAASGVGATVTFTPATAITNGTILEITYDTAFTGGGSLADADVTVTGTNITSSAESNFAAGYFRSTLTTSGSVTTQVTITIDATPGLTNPAAGNYSWSVTANIGAAGTTYDYGAGLAYVGNENDVNVTAVVPPVVDLELYQAGVDTLLSNPNACDLGVLSLAQVKTCAYDVATGTNNAAGVTVYVTSDALINDGNGNDLNSVADGTVTAGAEEYGIRITEAGAGEYTASGTFGSQYNAVPTSATEFATTATTGSGTGSGNTAERMEVTHAASMATDTVVGSYSHTVTYTAFTN
jgi:hypothetical protein